MVPDGGTDNLFSFLFWDFFRFRFSLLGVLLDVPVGSEVCVVGEGEGDAVVSAGFGLDTGAASVAGSGIGDGIGDGIVAGDGAGSGVNTGEGGTSIITSSNILAPDLSLSLLGRPLLFLRVDWLVVP